MGTEQKTTSPKTCVSPVSMRPHKAKPAGRIYASLVKHRVTWPEPSELARRDDVMKALWRASAVMVGSPNRNNWGRRSGERGISIAKMGRKPKAAMATLQNAREQGSS